jgi:hypothetical protein
VSDVEEPITRAGDRLPDQGTRLIRALLPQDGEVAGLLALCCSSRPAGPLLTVDTALSSQIRTSAG